jgi:hypothetical protein
VVCLFTFSLCGVSLYISSNEEENPVLCKAPAPTSPAGDPYQSPRWSTDNADVAPLLLLQTNQIDHDKYLASLLIDVL